jgi:hypothetical protein
MPAAVRFALIGLSLAFLAIGMYHRIRAAQSGDRLDRTKEGWPTLIGLRLAGLATFGSTAAWLYNPLWFEWAAFPVPDWARWIGVGGFAFGITWLIWMFISLGANLTDTVVTRRNAQFVDRGPYRYVRNPMPIQISNNQVSSRITARRYDRAAATNQPGDARDREIHRSQSGLINHDRSATNQLQIE